MAVTVTAVTACNVEMVGLTIDIDRYLCVERSRFGRHSEMYVRVSAFIKHAGSHICVAEQRRLLTYLAANAVQSIHKLDLGVVQIIVQLVDFRVEVRYPYHSDSKSDDQNDHKNVPCDVCGLRTGGPFGAVFLPEGSVDPDTIDYVVYNCKDCCDQQHLQQYAYGCEFSAHVFHLGA